MHVRYLGGTQRKVSESFREVGNVDGLEKEYGSPFGFGNS